MKQNSSFHKNGLRPALVMCLCMALAHGPILADGVTRTVESVAGGCKVTLAWEFTGKVESDLVIEERFAQGWSVDSTTVPFASLDASWFSGRVARFAVKPSLLSMAGSISFTVVPGEGAASGVAAGDWMMYLGGSLRKGAVAGQGELVAAGGGGTAGSAGSTGTAETTGTAGNTGTTGTGVAIKSFKVVGTSIELSYVGAPAGTLVVAGCAEFGKPWTEIKRSAIAAGDGKVVLGLDAAGSCRFFRLKVLAEEE